jgi:hypothetical protein
VFVGSLDVAYAVASRQPAKAVVSRRIVCSVSARLLERLSLGWGKLAGVLANSYRVGFPVDTATSETVAPPVTATHTLTMMRLQA